MVGWLLASCLLLRRKEGGQLHRHCQCCPSRPASLAYRLKPAPDTIGCLLRCAALPALQVVATPDIEEFSLEEGDEFLVIACDGIWDVLTNQEVGGW